VLRKEKGNRNMKVKESTLGYEFFHRKCPDQSAQTYKKTKTKK
jgi:hypothetical protein